jgi:D-alanyl-D-alanine carboxypeptidase
MKLKTVLQLITLCALTTEAGDNSPVEKESMENAVNSIRNSYGIPSISLAVFTEDSTYWKITTGTTTAEGKRHVTEEMPYHTGSLTKAMTSFAAANLVEEKKISWNTKFFSLFPELKESALSIYSDITLADLLSHRAGIAPYETGEELAELYREDIGKERYDFAKAVLSENSETVGQFTYSNGGYALATLMLEKVSQKGWEDLMEQYLHNDKNIDFTIGWPVESDPDNPRGHLEKEEGFIPGRSFELATAIQPSGDISLSLENFILWGKLNLALLEGSDSTLSSENRDIFYYGQEEQNQNWYPFEYGDMKFTGYSMGWYNTELYGTPYLLHMGSSESFYASIGIDLKENRVSVVLMNAYGENVENAAYEIHEEVRKRVLDN